MSATRRSNCICRQSLLMQQAQFPRTYPLPAHQAHPGSPRIGAEHARQDKVQSGDEPPLLGPDDRVASVHGEGRSSSLDARLGGGKLPSPRGFIAQLPITSHNSRDGRQAAPALGSGRDSEHTAISTAAEGGGQRPATVTVRSPRPAPEHKRARGERGRDAAQTAVAALKTSALPKSPRPCGSPLQSPAASRLRAVGATGGSAPREWRAQWLRASGSPGTYRSAPQPGRPGETPGGSARMLEPAAPQRGLIPRRRWAGLHRRLATDTSRSGVWLPGAAGARAHQLLVDLLHRAVLLVPRGVVQRDGRAAGLQVKDGLVHLQPAVHHTLSLQTPSAHAGRVGK